MNEVFVGSEVLRRGVLTRSRLRWNYTSLYPDVYVPNDVAPSLRQHTVGAWLWSGRRAIVAGRAAAALHGALWVHTGTPIELILTPARTRPPRGILARDELISDDELVLIDGMAVTNPARTAFDLSRHLHRDLAVRHLDALARATGIEAVDALAMGDRYRRARGRSRCALALDLMDGGAQSPKETSLRLLVIDYDGELHQTSRPRFVHDIGRNELVRRQGWLDLHVVAEHRRAFIVHRLDEAFAQRRYPLRLRPGS
jgi:hypothetical protein